MREEYERYKEHSPLNWYTVPIIIIYFAIVFNNSIVMIFSEIEYTTARIEKIYEGDIFATYTVAKKKVL